MRQDLQCERCTALGEDEEKDVVTESCAMHDKVELEALLGYEHSLYDLRV